MDDLNPEDVQWSQVAEKIESLRINELIVSLKNVPATRIIEAMRRFGSNLQVKIIPEEGSGIVGSSSKNEPGELYSRYFNLRLGQSGQRRSKRLFDLISSAILYLPLLMISLFRSKFQGRRISCGQVFWGSKSWIGYDPKDPDLRDLPAIKPGVFYPYRGNLDPQLLHEVQHNYASHYHWYRDAELLISKIFSNES